MNAAPESQLKLLDLQAVDAALARLAHRRKTLPEVAELAARDRDVAYLRAGLVDAQTEVDDLAAEQARLEQDVETVRARTARDEARLQAGGLPARELSSLQHEVATLGRRQASLEDDLLEIMERVEEAESAVAGTTRQLDAALAMQRDLVAKRDAAFAEIDAGLAERTPERAALAAEIPPDLLALYERARAQGGTGAALLRQRRCEACHLELSGSELSAVRSAAPDAVVRCDNCRAVLVRTAESGL